MYALFDKHGKKLLAVVGSILMLTFLLPGGFGRLNGGQSRLGKVYGQPVDVAEVQNAHNVLVALNRLRVKTQDPRTGTETVAAMPEAYFGHELAQSLSQNPLQWYLLLDEAARAGAAPEESAVEHFLDGDNQYAAGQNETDAVPLKDLNPSIKDGLRADVRTAMSVGAYFFRSQDFLKVSRPLVDDFLARRTQQLKARVAVFNDADFLAKAAAPTADESKRQFDAYANTAPATPTDANPFGFGYRVPDRVTLQYFTINDADVAAVVEKTQTPEKWAEDAMVYYLRHPADFQSTPSTSQPATRPTTKPFLDVQADASKKVHSPLIDAQRRKVATLVIKQLRAGFDDMNYKPAPGEQPGRKVTTAEGLRQANYLNTIADDVAKQTGVRPAVTDVPGLLDRTAVRNLTGLGNANPADAGRAYDPAAPADTADYLFEGLTPFAKTAKPDAAAAASTPGSTLDVLAPSKILRGSDAVYVVRVTAAEPAHAPTMDAVKEQVDKDVRRGKAYTLAQTAAQDAVKQADAVGGLTRVAGLTVQQTDWFGPAAPAVTGLPADAAQRLVAPAYDTLEGLKSVAELPKRTIAKLRGDDRAIAIEVFDARATLTDAVEADARAEAGQRLLADTTDPRRLQTWFGMDGVSKRVGYVADSAAERDSQRPGPAPQAPGSPFTP